MRGGVIPLLLRSIQGPLCQPCADRSSCRFRPPKWAFRIPLTQKAIQMAIRWRYGSASTDCAPRVEIDRYRSRCRRSPVPRDAADLMAAVTKAVAAGHITPSEAAEIAKVIDAYVKAYQTAELDERVARVEQLMGRRTARHETQRHDQQDR